MDTFVTRKNVPKNYTGICRIFDRSETRYYVDGVLHRENGPAVINNDGSKAWYWKGMLHRDDGPAIVVEISYFSSAGIKTVVDETYYFKGKKYKNKQEYISDPKIKTVFNKRLIESINDL